MHSPGSQIIHLLPLSVSERDRKSSAQQMWIWAGWLRPTQSTTSLRTDPVSVVNCCITAGWKNWMHPTMTLKWFMHYFCLFAGRGHLCVSAFGLNIPWQCTDLKWMPLKKMWIKRIIYILSQYCLVMMCCQATTPTCISIVRMTIWMEITIMENYGIVKRFMHSGSCTHNRFSFICPCIPLLGRKEGLS